MNYRNSTLKFFFYQNKFFSFSFAVVAEPDSDEEDCVHLLLTDNKSNKEHVSFYYFEIHVLLYHISILACSSFVQLYFYFKLLMMIVGISIYLIGFQMQKSYQAVADSMDTTHFFLFAELFIQLFFFVLFLHLIDRRVIREKIFF